MHLTGLVDRPERVEFLDDVLFVGDGRGMMAFWGGLKARLVFRRVWMYGSCVDSARSSRDMKRPGRVGDGNICDCLVLNDSCVGV